MYYMVTATHAKDGEDGVTFEYVANAPDIECVYGMAEDSGERVLSIQEMTMPELIEHEKQELMDTVARTYVFAKYKDKDFDKFDKKCPYYSKNSAIEELISLNGKIVTLIGKYNESKDTFYVCGMLEK
jgi:hypothetical protein